MVFKLVQALLPWYRWRLKMKQGFLTSSGRFVDRVEAAEIAYAAGQVRQRSTHEGKPGTLYSEDLY